MSVRMQHCFWCGKELGVYDNYGEEDTCGKSECARELRNSIQAERENRTWDAIDDDFSRY